MSKYHVVSFYQIDNILDHERLSRDVTRYATKHSLLGTFFSTPQGINTTMSGEREALEGLIEMLESKFNLSLFNPKWSISEDKPFKRLRVRLKPRLLPLEGEFDPVLQRGKHLEAAEWNKVISDPNTLVIDVRNDYETDIGTFKNSIIPNMKDFTEFPEFIDKEIVKEQIKNWNVKDTKKLIYKINEIEILIKKNSSNSLHIISDFILSNSNKFNNYSL